MAEEQVAQPIDSFETKRVFGDDTSKSKVEHQFGFSELDLEEYAAKIETKVDVQVQEKAEEVPDERDFTSGTEDLEKELADLDNQVGDMQSLNLFGI